MIYVPPEDLGEIVTRTYSPKVFRAPEVTPVGSPRRGEATVFTWIIPW